MFPIFPRFTTGEDVKKEILEIIDTLIDAGEDLYFIRDNYSIVNKYFRWKVDDVDRIEYYANLVSGRG